MCVSATGADDTPQNNVLFGLWGSAANDVWAVGTFGDLFRWNGST